jgi:hypothetical protein
MASLKEMFRDYLADFFPDEAEFEDDGGQRLRITYPIPEAVPGQRYSRPVVLLFDKEVIAAFAAIAGNDVARQDRIGELLEEMVGRCLQDYDEGWPPETAFQIDVDSRVLDL